MPVSQFPLSINWSRPFAVTFRASGVGRNVHWSKIFGLQIAGFRWAPSGLDFHSQSAPFFYLVV